MKQYNKIEIEDLDILLIRFNNREVDAFTEVYNMYYSEIVYYAKKLFYNTPVSAHDTVQDIFVKLLVKDEIKFSNLIKMKSYLYSSIKNAFLDYLSHDKCVDKFNRKLFENPNYYVSQMVESETLSIITEALDVLPQECAKVFKLHLDGWNVKEISEKLGKAPSTIYTQKQDAIKLLKNIIESNKLLYMMPITVIITIICTF